MKTEITAIKLKLAAREIELTAQEAREVQKALNELFEMQKSELEKLKDLLAANKPAKEYVPYPVYPPPIYVDRTSPYWPNRWDIWCGPNGTFGTLVMALDSQTAAG